MQTRYLIFIGRPGVGKSTLIAATLPRIKIVDIDPFANRIQEERIIEAYKEMYNHLDLISDDSHDIVVEIGASHAKFNIDAIKKLKRKRKVNIFLCDASIETCLARVNAREQQLEGSVVHKRLSQVFPVFHLQYLAHSGLDYVCMDMEKPLIENKLLLETLLAR